MNHASSSLFDKTFEPVYQALFCLGATLVITLLGKLVDWIGLITVSPQFPWMSSAAFILFFAMFNSVFSLSAKNMPRYWGRSIYSFIALVFSSGFFATILSSLSINEAGSYRWIFFVLTLSYLVFLSIVTFIRRIVEFAQREEWNHPRIRRKNPKK